MDSTTIKARATALELFDAARAELAGDDACAPLVTQVQGHAVEVACMARELASSTIVDPGHAFAAGLLHDVGELLLLRQDPLGYRELLSAAGDDHAEQLRLEKQHFGTDHALLGAYHLLDHRVPHVVADAVADHHDPLPDSDLTTLLVAAVDEILGDDDNRRLAVGLAEARGLVVRVASEPR